MPENIPFDDVLDFHLKNTAMKSWWKTPETEFIHLSGNTSAPIPDISKWIDSTLVLSPRAYRLLGELLQPSGELLPVSIGEETYYIFNCFILGKEDEEKSRFEPSEGMQIGLELLEFKDSAAELLIFKSKLESCLSIFCGERFKNTVESFELNGIIFDENLIKEYSLTD